MRRGGLASEVGMSVGRGTGGDGGGGGGGNGWGATSKFWFVRMPNGLMKTVPRRTPKKGVAKGVSKIALATRGGPAPRGRKGVVRRARMAPGKPSGDRRR